MPISTRYQNNPNVKRALSNSIARERELYGETSAQILAVEREIQFIQRELSRYELERIARFEAYVLAHERDILAPDGPLGPM